MNLPFEMPQSKTSLPAPLVSLYPREPLLSTDFQVGLDVLFERHRSKLTAFHRIGLLSHQAAVDRTGATAAQRLRAELGSRLVALFGPEHGYFGAAGAGELTRTRRYPGWNIPVYSLYGTHRKPTPRMLNGLDLVICDLQDIGVRCYTYLATLRLMLHACTERGIPVMILDRPIPLPNTVDGPITEPEFTSFVAPCPLPMVYGMTPSETATWIKTAENLDLDLTVIPMSGWHREHYRLPGAPEFIPPSPAIRSWTIAQTYPATVFCEALPLIDCARETGLAFRLLGLPYRKTAAPLCDRLNAFQLPGITFHPHRYTPTGKTPLDAIRLTLTNPDTFKPVITSYALLHTLSETYGRQKLFNHPTSRPEWLQKLYGINL